MRSDMSLLAVLLSPVLLAACNKASDNTPPNQSAANAAAGKMTREAVATQMAEIRLKPGQWEGRFVMEQVDMRHARDMPPGADAQMKRAMSRTLRYCVTPDQAAHPDGRAFTGEERKDCSYAGFQAHNGQVSGTINCQRDGFTTRMAMTGRYAPDHYAMRMDMTQGGLPDAMTMTMKARSEGKWIGPECSEE